MYKYFFAFIIIFFGYVIYVGDFESKSSIYFIDFTHTFYMAGYLVSHNLTKSLYFDLNCDFNAYQNSFNIYAHQLFPDLPKNLYSYFFYPPTTALVFIPFSYLKVNIALFLWQLLSYIILAIVIRLMSFKKNNSITNLIFLLLTFMPLIDTIIQGQVNILLGLIPILLSYYFFKKEKLLLGGSVLSITLLKPQYLPLSLLIIGYSLFKKKYKIALGFILSISFIVILTNIYFHENIYWTWIQNFKLFDSAFKQDKFAYPLKLVSSLVALIIELFKLNLNKMAIYFSALVLSLITLYKSIKISFKDIDLVYILGAGIIPIISPHLLFYDLAILAIIFILSYLENRIQLKPIVLVIWLIFNLNGTLLLFIDRSNIYPNLIAQALYLCLYLRILFSRKTQEQLT